MFFQPLKDLANLMINSNINKIINTLIKRPEFTNLIIELNTFEQLHEKGIDSLGVSLGQYSPTTIQGTAAFAGRAERGLRYDHITLFDTGDFYKSFKVIIRNESDSFFLIDADPVKEDTNLFQEWGEDIVGLTQESIDVLNDKLRTELTKEIKKLLAS
jgi:hypothetical protein